MAKMFIRAAAVAAAAGLAFTLAACGSSGESTESSEAPSNGGSSDLEKVTAGVIPVTDSGPIVLSQETDIWADNGLELTIESANSSPNIISAVMSGDYRIGYAGVTSVFQAVEQGIDLVIIEAASATGGPEPENGINDILVKPDSPLQSAAELEGKKVAVNALGGYVQLLAMIAIGGEGGDVSKVEWVELPVPDQPAALENGAIDAYVAGEPFGTLGRAQGYRVLANPHALLHDEAVVAGVWFASRADVEARPDYYKKVVTALDESNAYAGENDEALRMAISEFTGLDADLAMEIRLGSYGKLPLTIENVQPVADAATEFGLVKTAPDLEAMIWKP